jgi:hypothetical protein
MARAFTLSHAAIDILCERLRTSPSPFPFEIARHGRTDEQRAGIRRAVFGDLERRNLAYRGRAEDDVDEALVLFTNPVTLIAAFGKLDRGQKLFARTCSNGQSAIRAVADVNAVRFEPIHVASVVSSAVSLLPPSRPGVGQSVTFPRTAPAQPEPSGEGFTRMVSAPRSTATMQVRAAETMLGQPKIRFGQFRVTVRGRHGRDQHAPDVFWFDTQAGRYVTHSSTGQDGQGWSTFAPADTPRLAQLLSAQLNQLTIG